MSDTAPFIPLQELWGGGAWVGDVPTRRLLGTSTTLSRALYSRLDARVLLRLVEKSDILLGVAQVCHIMQTAISVDLVSLNLYDPCSKH